MKTYQWAVVGAGPAGMAAIGKLIDAGIKPASIAWIDPDFKVGDLGEKWRAVSSNTRVELFLKFLEGCQSFRYGVAPSFNLNNLHPDKTCLLKEIAEPLQWVSNHLCEAVATFKTHVRALRLESQVWHIQTDGESFAAASVVLAIGAEPKKLDFPNLKEIPVEAAFTKLPDLSGETVAVFGSSHSSMIVLRNLMETKVKKVINFYNSPLKFAVYMKDWILFDNTGLKGESAIWARQHIHGKHPERLERMQVSHPHFKQALAQCQSVVYTVGFEKRIPPEVPEIGELRYNASNGIIAPGLFGLGIAFPQRTEDCFGNVEYNVGLWKFMVYLEKILPIWMEYGP